MSKALLQWAQEEKVARRDNVAQRSSAVILPVPQVRHSVGRRVDATQSVTPPIPGTSRLPSPQAVPGPAHSARQRPSPASLASSPASTASAPGPPLALQATQRGKGKAAVRNPADLKPADTMSVISTPGRGRSLAQAVRGREGKSNSPKSVSPASATTVLNTRTSSPRAQGSRSTARSPVAQPEGSSALSRRSSLLSMTRVPTPPAARSPSIPTNGPAVSTSRRGSKTTVPVIQPKSIYKSPLKVIGPSTSASTELDDLDKCVLFTACAHCQLGTMYSFTLKRRR